MVAGAAALSSLRAQAVGDWEQMSSDGADLFYCREFLFDMAWKDMDLSQKRLACATFGGPIASIRDESEMVVLKGGSAQPVLRLFSAAGEEQGQLLWERGKIAGMGWSSSQDLLVLEVSGKVTAYNVHGVKQPLEFSFGAAVESQGVAACCVHPGGIVLLTAGNQLWGVDSLAEPRPRQLAVPAGLRGAAPNCMAVVPPEHTAGGMEVLLGTDTCVYNCDEHAAHEQPLLPPAAVVCIRPSHDGQFVALFTRDGRLLVMSIDMSKTLAEFATMADEAPLQMEWCGGDAVVLLWEDIMLLVGPYGDCIRYTVEAPTFLVSEVDGLRLLTSSQQELLRKVPEAVVDVFKPGSTAPAALLWEARDAFEQRSARADKILRDMRERLGEAVDSCVQAAGAVLRIPQQRALLKAAVFGGAFCPGGALPPTQLHSVCQKLRVLNAVRAPHLGIPLTMAQLEALTLPVLISRLVSGHQHLVAYRIACMAGSGVDAVVVHWACAKISSPASSALSDSALKEEIMAKLKGMADVRFAAIAEHAQAVGRRKLAIKLLEEERSSSQQVPRLLALWRPRDTPSGAQAGAGAGAASGASPSGGADAGGGGGSGGEEDTLSKALSKAVESRDPDLVYMVLFHALKHLRWEDFWALICRRSLPRSLFYKHCRVKNPELLEQTWSSGGLHSELAAWKLQQALRQWQAGHPRSALFSPAAAAAAAGGGGGPAGAGGSSARGGEQRAEELALTKLSSSLGSAAAQYGQSKETGWHARSCAEWGVLLREQAKLEKETGQQLFLGLTLVDTIRECIRLDNPKALQFKKMFGVSDKRWYWIKVQVLAANHDWKALDEFAGERKPPIGLEPFLECAKAHEAPRDWQARLIARMPDSKAKAEAFTLIDYPREAAEIAAKLRDGDLFAKIADQVSANSPAGLAIAQIRERFQSTFRYPG